MKNEQTETTDDNYRYREEIKEVLCLNSSLSNNDNTSFISLEMVVIKRVKVTAPHGSLTHGIDTLGT